MCEEPFTSSCRLRCARGTPCQRLVQGGQDAGYLLDSRGQSIARRRGIVDKLGYFFLTFGYLPEELVHV